MLTKYNFECKIKIGKKNFFAQFICGSLTTKAGIALPNNEH